MLDILLVILGITYIIGGLITKTQNFILSLVYKVIPFFSGLYLLFYYGITKGYISL